jgi:hypothetical protein
MDNLPPLLKDFIRSVTPDAAKGPLHDLHDRYDDRRRERARELNGVIPIGYPKGSPEYNVEIRIRDWVRRMEAEKAEIERMRKKNDDAPPQIKPPKP